MSAFHMALGSKCTPRTLRRPGGILSLAWRTESSAGRCFGGYAHATALETSNASVQEGVIDVDIRDGFRVGQHHYASIGTNTHSASAL
jgi:hypothetical protein